MSLAVRLRIEPVRTLAFGSIGAAYIGVGTSLTKPARVFLIQNLTDESLMFSFDGIDDHLPLPRDGYFVFDITANKTAESGFFLAEGTRLYVKEIVSPTLGAVYFTTFYGVAP